VAPSDTAVDATDTDAASSPPRPSRRPGGLLLGGVLAVILVAAAIGYLTRSSGDTDDPGLVHVHGLGVNPGDGALYAATHTGLFRLDGAGDAERVGDRYQDTMGFTIAGPDRFFASGHPDLRDEDLRVEGKPPLLGLIESTDRGRTWQPRSLLGDADLHAIVADGDRVIAYDSTGERVLASGDGGRTFAPRSSITLVDLAVDPEDATHIVAVTPDGDMLESRDGARTWTPHPAVPPGGLAVLRWDDGGLWGGTAGGGLARYDDATRAWVAVHDFGAPVEAIVFDGDDVYVAAEGVGILRSGDGGRRWDELYRPPPS